MGFREQMASDVMTFFNTSEFAEQIEYISAGKTVRAIVEYLDDFGGSSDMAEYVNLWLCLADIGVWEIANQDRLSIDGESWKIVRRVYSDTMVAQVVARRDERKRL